ncbi:hypothetical protein HanXRQr2_Chr03g0124711 [Helianthus annuus]|uniref:Uncharacterized protein n=1 Tax=Helianthus annuus TaxID=4232 RepID=A0A9K3NW69_HELAN|nr:hypothetical protein HanXRQr2_Chr03g0124711 [Helianthus annuus]KAJ0594024.1 hypothetical protein HanHA300_Chr03g0103931 [Helianthus annuus]KAJ0602087.1 hypothetical protein HanIR_Chr03g0135841 [Helianthus annuus]KAJ0769109.1 hypothetical protein HanLR1_Chr03g0109151 [Helianthus annuus]
MLKIENPQGVRGLLGFFVDLGVRLPGTKIGIGWLFTSAAYEESDGLSKIVMPYGLYLTGTLDWWQRLVVRRSLGKVHLVRFNDKNDLL